MNSNKYTTPRQKLRREKTSVSDSSESSRDPVHVYCRLRPLKENRESTCIKLLSPQVLSLTTPAQSKSARKELHYKFKHIFTSYSSQRELFDHIAYPLLEDLIKGRNALLFTYGITGSGKTYTLTGDENNPGIMPRCIDTIFNSIGENQAPKYVIKSDKMNGFEVQSESEATQDRLLEVRTKARAPKTVRSKMGNGDAFRYANDGIKIPLINESSLVSVYVSYIEIYNNTVFDLLDESSGKSLQSKILREDTYKNVYVNGVVEVEVKSAEEAFEVFNQGQRRKRMGDTVLNSESSRSHSIFNIRLVQLEQQALNADGNPMIPEGNLMQISQFSLVDLAGSERTSRTQTSGARLREASAINNSLMALRNCMEILRENQMKKANRVVPYRDTRLTQLFKNYFEGEGSVQMIICVNPSVDDFEENLQVMRFADITQDVKIAKSEAKYTPIHKRMVEKVSTITPSKSTKKAQKSKFILLPDIPVPKFNFDDMEGSSVQIENLIRILKLRKNKSRDLNHDCDNRIKEFRNRLVELDKDVILNKNEMRTMKNLIQKEKYRSNTYQTKIVELENVNDSLAHKNGELEDVIRALQNKIDEKDRKLNINCLEKERQKQKLTEQSNKMTQELDNKLRRQREYLNAAMKAKDNKLRKLKEVIDSEMVVSVEMSEIEQPNNLFKELAKENQTPRASARGTVPISTPHNRRRSRSAGGEVWLEHNVVKPVPLGTVMQPVVKKRKSLTKLSKAEDITNPKQSKYCLITQDADTEGELETRVYKGDIVATCGGGAQVVFNDVECLRQESPTH